MEINNPASDIADDEWHIERILETLTMGSPENVLCVVEILHTTYVPIAHTFFALPRSGNVRGIENTMDRTRYKAVGGFGVSVSRDLGADVPKVVLFSAGENQTIPERNLSVLHRVHHRFPSALLAVEDAVRGMRRKWSYTVTPTGVQWRPPGVDSEGMLAGFFHAHTSFQVVSREMWSEGLLALRVDHRPDPRHDIQRLPYTTPYIEVRNSSWCSISELPHTWRQDVGKSKTVYVDRNRGRDGA